uniref:RNA polymerase II subunit B1 CTD phosphatase RPAP2 homolog n=1 Tax=Lygus hesperus TaxID=30085 RepID=A0A0A9X3C6_LYGHE
MDSSAAKRKKKVVDAKKRMQNMTKEQIKAAIEKKKECNARAMAIVERLIEPQVETFWLIENLIHINQSHFQDAVEERAITKCCGYPLCDALLRDIPNKQFHISTKQNKVYDITDRKNYCSNLCYRAGIFLKDQLFTSPLWLRDCENRVTYKLYSSAPISGITGQEIDLGNTNPVKFESDDSIENKAAEAEKNRKNLQNTVSDRNRDESDTEIEDEFEDANEELEVSDQITTAAIDGLEDDEFFLSRTAFSEAEHGGSKKSVSDEGYGGGPDAKVDEIASGLKAIEVSEAKKTDKRKSGSKESVNKKLKPNLPVGQKIESFVMEWFTLESLTFIYGEEEVKQKFTDFGSPVNEIKFNKLKDSYMYERYEEICRKLNILEIRDRDETAAHAPSKPLPDYDQLKRESKELELKVRSFFKGDVKVGFTVDEGEEGKKKDEVDDNPAVLPLVDRHAVKAVRRRIMLDKLKRTLPDIQSALNLNQFGLSRDIQELVFTLSLSASNIVMKPSEWNLVVIILIRIMTIKNKCLGQAYQSDLTQRRLVNLLMTYNLDVDYLERQVLIINDLELIIRNSQ